MNQVVGTGTNIYAVTSNILSGSSSARVYGFRGSAYKPTAYSTGRTLGLYGQAGNGATG